MRFLLIFSFFLLYSGALFAQGAQVESDAAIEAETNFEEQLDDQLVIVQAVSTSKKSFAVRKGRVTGILVGQESVFSTANISMVARAVEVNRHFSLWVPVGKDALVPFSRQEFVTYSNSIESIFTEIPQLRAQEKSVRFEPKNYFTMRASFSVAISESVSQTDADRRPARSGLNLEALYHRQWTKKLNWGAGIRYDLENATQEDVNLTIPSTRLYFIAEMDYTFGRWKNSKNAFFMGICAGIGRSQTTVSETVSTGLSLLLPSVRGGIRVPLKNKNELLLSLVIENISSKERFLNDEQGQDTNILNSKISLGYRF